MKLSHALNLQRKRRCIGKRFLELTAVDKHYSDQKTTEIVAWLLFAPAVFAYDSGQKEATELAVLKGQLEAVRQAQMNKKC